MKPTKGNITFKASIINSDIDDSLGMVINAVADFRDDLIRSAIYRFDDYVKDAHCDALASVTRAKKSLIHARKHLDRVVRN